MMLKIGNRVVTRAHFAQEDRSSHRTLANTCGKSLFAVGDRFHLSRCAYCTVIGCKTSSDVYFTHHNSQQGKACHCDRANA